MENVTTLGRELIAMDRRIEKIEAALDDDDDSGRITEDDLRDLGMMA